MCIVVVSPSIRVRLLVYMLFVSGIIALTRAFQFRCARDSVVLDCLVPASPARVGESYRRGCALQSLVVLL
eukprot:4360445-Prorocentrum_lima.AAC.1